MGEADCLRQKRERKRELARLQPDAGPVRLDDAHRAAEMRSRDQSTTRRPIAPNGQRPPTAAVAESLTKERGWSGREESHRRYPPRLEPGTGRDHRPIRIRLAPGGLRQKAESRESSSGPSAASGIGAGHTALDSPDGRTPPPVLPHRRRREHRRCDSGLRPTIYSRLGLDRRLGAHPSGPSISWGDLNRLRQTGHRRCPPPSLGARQTSMSSTRTRSHRRAT